MLARHLAFMQTGKYSPTSSPTSSPTRSSCVAPVTPTTDLDLHSTDIYDELLDDSDASHNPMIAQNTQSTQSNDFDNIHVTSSKAMKRPSSEWIVKYYSLSDNQRTQNRLMELKINYMLSVIAEVCKHNCKWIEIEEENIIYECKYIDILRKSYESNINKLDTIRKHANIFELNSTISTFKWKRTMSGQHWIDRIQLMLNYINTELISSELTRKVLLDYTVNININNTTKFMSEHESENRSENGSMPTTYNGLISKIKKHNDTIYNIFNSFSDEMHDIYNLIWDPYVLNSLRT